LNDGLKQRFFQCLIHIQAQNSENLSGNKPTLSRR
jgi:hypothetical protein